MIRPNTILLIFAISILAQSQKCGHGVPILVRVPTSQGNYQLYPTCYCPIDYYGMQCKNHRRIHCYLSEFNQSLPAITQEIFQEEMKIKVIVEAECMIEESRNTFISLSSYFINMELQRSSIKQSLQIEYDGMEVVWINDSSLFDQRGNMKYQQGYNYSVDSDGRKVMSEQDQKEIMYGAGPYSFQYNSSFLDFPLTNGYFQIKLNVLRVLKNNIEQQPQNLSFINTKQYLQFINSKLLNQSNIEDRIKNIDITKPQSISIQDFATDIKTIQLLNPNDLLKPQFQCQFTFKLRQMTEFGMLRAEVAIVQYFDEHFMTRTSVNAAAIRIPVRVQGIGEAVVYNKNFDPPTSRWIYGLWGIILMGLGYWAYLTYLKRKQRKLRIFQQRVQQQQQ